MPSGSPSLWTEVRDEVRHRWSGGALPRLIGVWIACTVVLLIASNALQSAINSGGAVSGLRPVAWALSWLYGNRPLLEGVHLTSRVDNDSFWRVAEFLDAPWTAARLLLPAYAMLAVWSPSTAGGRVSAVDRSPGRTLFVQGIAGLAPLVAIVVACTIAITWSYAAALFQYLHTIAPGEELRIMAWGEIVASLSAPLEFVLMGFLLICIAALNPNRASGFTGAYVVHLLLFPIALFMLVSSMIRVDPSSGSIRNLEIIPLLANPGIRPLVEGVLLLVLLPITLNRLRARFREQ